MGKTSKQKAMSSKGDVTKDPRFSNIGADLRFKPIKTSKTIISADDDRFKALRQVTSIQGMMDPRGRKFNVKRQMMSSAKQMPKKSAVQQQSQENEAGGDDDDDSGENSEDDEATPLTKSEKKKRTAGVKGVAKESIGECDDMDEDEEEEAIARMNKAMEVSPEEREGLLDGLTKEQMEQLMDPNLDIIRGVDKYCGDSTSSDEESSDEEEEEEEYDWGEVDKDAQWDVDGYEVEESERLAVCNLDWNRFKAQDILMILRSFAPEDGSVLSVAVYLSEFGKQRVAEEATMGPKEVRELPRVNENSKCSKGETDYETIRKYHFNTLKCYYAVAECNSIETARAVYHALDGTALESGARVDLRYIPSDMTFDENPESECSGAPEVYDSSVIEGFSASNFVRAQYTWDGDNLSRKKTIVSLADADTFDDNEKIDNILAGYSESEDEDDSTEESQNAFKITSVFKSAEKRSAADSIKKYRWLLDNADKFDHTNEDETKLLMRTLGDEALVDRPPIVMYNDQKDGVDKEEEMELSSEDDKEDDSDLTLFEKYLQKRKKKEKEYKKAKKAKLSGGNKKEKDGLSDIPDELKNDPFFKEEIQLRRKETIKRNEKKREEEDNELAKERLARQQREEEMSLLMMDDESSGPRHVDMRALVKQAKDDAAAGGKPKKLSRWKMAKITAKEKRLAKKGIVLQGVEEATAAPQPAAPPPVAPKLVVDDERFSGIFESSRAHLDPSHPEFNKHRTPFLDGIVQEVQNKAIRQQAKKRKRAQE